jgi:hypothetical protein
MSRTQKYRSRMQKQGFRQINLWVPDTRAVSFARECKRQSRLTAHSGNEVLAAMGDVAGWTA